jgi:threonine dehydratase
MAPSAPSTTLTVDTVRTAMNRIRGEIIRTPLVLSEAASDWTGAPVHLKLESLQRTGPFKVRGALRKVSSLSVEERQRGLICSSGNHVPCEKLASGFRQTARNRQLRSELYSFCVSLSVRDPRGIGS